MRRLFTLGFMTRPGIGFVFAGILITGAAFGQNDVIAQTQQPAPAQKAAEQVTINGQVSAVTAATVTVLDEQKAEHTIILDANTTITKAGKTATVADLKANDIVEVVANKGEGDTWTAASITVA